MKIYKILIPLIIILIVFSIDSFAQDKKQVAADMSVKLQQKVLLSNEQTAKVKAILENYLQKNSQSGLQEAQKNVESILDKRQKAKYDIIKNDWWNSIQKENSAANQKE